MFFDWQQFHSENTDAPSVVDPRRRLKICLAGFVVLLLVVFGRAVHLEVTQGAGFRTAAMRPIERQNVLPAARGRILARDGAPLAQDRIVPAVAVEYRWLQEPADDGWLTAQARARLPKAARRDRKRLAVARSEVLEQRNELARRLTALCGLSSQQWIARTRSIQLRVERIADAANLHRQLEAAEPAGANDSWAVRIRQLLQEDPPPRIVVTEELEHHVVAGDVSAAVVAEIGDHPDRYRGAKIVNLTRRTYPEGTLAAHVLGHLGAGKENELVGQMGIERQYEALLRGQPGVAIEQLDRGGHVVKSYCRREPLAGRDLELSLDVRLQRTAEQLLQNALQRRAIARHRPEESSGGAIAVMDVDTGDILAAASAPNFDPNLFAQEDNERLAALLAERSGALFNRVCSMAIPPGSTFKTLTAVALLESDTVDPRQPFSCRGYLHQPDRRRCDIFVRQGIGHGEVTLADALAVSCNVYFFHFAELMGPRPLVRWAERFGFGRPTGVDLPGETAGTLPPPENAEVLSLAIGQGSLTATPLQMLRLMAAVANGGRLVAPHVAKRVQSSGFEVQDSGSGVMRPLNPEPRTPNPNVQLSRRTLTAVCDGLRRVVADPKGTAHATVFIESIPVAGKTGTAETGGDLASHAWFAGYAPADRPKLAFVIVLEHAGDAATAAGPVAKRLVLRMEQLGML